MMIYEEIGKKIKTLRESAEMSQQELAEKLGYESNTAVHLIERGQRKVNIETLNKLASIFTMTIDDLIGKKRKSINFPEKAIASALRSDDFKFEESDISEIINYIKFRRNANSHSSKEEKN